MKFLRLSGPMTDLIGDSTFSSLSETPFVSLSDLSTSESSSSSPEGELADGTLSE